MTGQYDTVKLKVKKSAVLEFVKTLQGGFYIKSPEGISVMEFLTEICKVSNDYIVENVKTVFINQKPADKLDEVLIAPEMTCALSGAMPGLVGAMMRMGSFYSVLREGITYHNSGSGKTGNETLVKLKLFNKVLYDKGPEFLLRGIYADKNEFLNLLKVQIIDKNIEGIEINGKKLKNVTFNDPAIELLSNIIYYKIDIK
jgi:hypothetical protein